MTFERIKDNWNNMTLPCKIVAVIGGIIMLPLFAIIVPVCAFMTLFE